MERIINLTMTKDEAAELGAAMDQCLKTIRESIEQIDQAEVETLRLRAETRAMLNQLGVMLNVEKSL